MTVATNTSSKPSAAEEQASLLPSPHSTDDPTSVQYGSLQAEQQKEPLIQMTSSNPNLAAQSSQEEFYPSDRPARIKRRWVYGLLAAVAVAVIAAFAVVHVVTPNGNKESKAENKAAKAADVASKSTNSVHKQR